MMREHTRDSDCTATIVEHECSACGVYHGDPCRVCGGRGFHNEPCPGEDGEHAEHVRAIRDNVERALTRAVCKSVDATDARLTGYVIAVTRLSAMSDHLRERLERVS